MVGTRPELVKEIGRFIVCNLLGRKLELSF